MRGHLDGRAGFKAAVVEHMALTGDWPIDLEDASINGTSTALLADPYERIGEVEICDPKAPLILDAH